MSPGLSPQVRRFAAVGILLAILTAVWSLVIQPTVDALTELDAAISQAREDLVRFRRIAATRSALEAQLAEVRRVQALGRAVIAAATPQLAAAEIQTKVRGLISTSKSTVKSMQVLPAKDDGNFRRVSLRINMEGDLDGVQKVLHGLESAVPYLIVPNIEIRGRQGAGASHAGRLLPELVVAFDVLGYARIASP